MSPRYVREPSNDWQSWHTADHTHRNKPSGDQKSIVLSHKNITHFHLVLLECSCLTQPPYSEETQRAMIKQLMWRRTKTSSPQLHSAPASPCEWAPFKVDLLAPSWTSSTGTLWNKVKSSSTKSAQIPYACTYVAYHVLSRPQQKVSGEQIFLPVLLTAVSSIPRIVLFYIAGAQEVFVEWMHEWMNWLQFCRQVFELSWDLPQLLTLPPILLSFQTDGLDSTEDPCTYLDMSPLVPGNSSFHFWRYILGCRHKSSFQDCCGKSNALGKFWDSHIHPHLVSRNEKPHQGRGRSQDRGLKTGDSLQVFATSCSQIPRLFPSPKLPLQLGVMWEIFWPTVWTHKTVKIVSSHNDHWLQKWLSSFTPPCVHNLGWGSCYTMQPCHSSL